MTNVQHITGHTGSAYDRFFFSECYTQATHRNSQAGAFNILSQAFFLKREESMREGASVAIKCDGVRNPTDLRPAYEAAASTACRLTQIRTTTAGEFRNDRDTICSPEIPQVKPEPLAFFTECTGENTLILDIQHKFKS